MNKHRKLVGVVGLCAGLMLSLSACTTTSPLAGGGESSAAGSESPKGKSLEGAMIGITVADLANQYYVSVTEGMKKACEKAGCTVEVHDGKQDTLGQIAAVESFITKGADVIVIAANADNALDGAAKQAKDAGIPVVALAQQTGGVDAFIRLSEEEAGMTSGGVAADWIKKNLAAATDAKVLVIGDKTVSNTAQRIEGIKKGVEKGAPGAVVVAEAPANSSESALAATENALTANPGINVVIANNDDIALGSYEAMVAAGKKAGQAAVIGFDATPEAISKILEKGIFVGTVSIDASKQGDLVVETARKVLAEGTIGDIYVPFDPVTIDNAAQYR